jgi:hypothetical protein
MIPEDVSGTVAALLAAAFDIADRDEIAVVVRQSREVRSWLDSIDVRCARRTRELAVEGRAEPAESLLGDQGQRSSNEAVAITHRTHVCDSMPSFEAALAAGTISGGHVDAVANTIRRLDVEIRGLFIDHQPQLLIAAGRERVEQFERTCRDLVHHLTAIRDDRAGTDTRAAELERQRAASRVKQWVDRQSGMHHTHVELDPERGAKLKAAIDAHLRRARKRAGNSGTPWNQLEVGAFMNAVTAGVTCAGGTTSASGSPEHAGSTASGGPSGLRPSGGHLPSHRVEPIPEANAHLRVPEILVLIDQHSLLVGAHEHGICETSDGIPLPIATARRMCCDADIIPAVLNGRGEVTDLGRGTRTISRAQRRKLRAMHRTCIGPDCTVAFDACQIHHVIFWRKHGRTDIDNLVPVCSDHHHLAHEGGWGLTLTAGRVITWTRPDGNIHSVGTCITRAPDGIRPRVPQADVTNPDRAGPERDVA